MEKNKKNRIISFIVTFFYSLMSGISFLCFYHNVVISSWLLEIIVSIVLLLALSLLSYKKIKTIILPIMMTIMIGIIYSFQSFYYGFFGIMNYIIECYNTKFEDARNMMMAASITSSHIQAMSLVIVIWMTYYIYQSIKKEKYTVLSILFFVLFSFTLWIDCFSFVGGALFSINALMVWMYHQNKVINTKTIQWFIILCIIFVSLAIPSYQDNLTIEQIKEDVLQQVDDLRYGKDNLPQGDLNKASRIHENNQERLEITVSQRKNLYLKGFVGSTLENNQWQDLTKASYNGEHEGMLKWLKKKKFSSTYQYNLYQKLSKNDDQKQNVTINNVAANKKYLYTPYSINQSDVTSSNIQKDLNLQSIALFGSKSYSYQETSSTSPSELMVGSDWLNNPNASQKEYLDTESIYRSFVYENYQTVDKGLEKTISQLFDQDDFENTGIYSVCQHIRDTMTSYLKYNDQISDKDSLEDFLNQKTAGNDVLFSTVAVEAFRYYDIPARYVEGYYLKSDAIDDEGNATLTSKDGHAWVEVYFDGMGWLPIDVTPGYYYDVYTLMNMVATPQGEQSDTNIEKGHQDSQSVDDGQNGGMINDLIDHVGNLGMMSLGVLTIVCVVIFIIWILLELLRLILNIGVKYIYHHASSKNKTKYLYSLMEMYLKSYGIDYQLGLDSIEVDETLEKMDLIHQGDFLRVCRLFEKSFYGEIELEEFELNIIVHFIVLLYQNQKGLKWYNKLKRRYTILSRKDIYLKLIKRNEGD
jgi:protein-glutamine gamma-glutamyltransferase